MKYIKIINTMLILYCRYIVVRTMSLSTVLKAQPSLHTQTVAESTEGLRPKSADCAHLHQAAKCCAYTLLPPATRLHSCAPATSKILLTILYSMCTIYLSATGQISSVVDYESDTAKVAIRLSTADRPRLFLPIVAIYTRSGHDETVRAGL